MLAKTLRLGITEYFKNPLKSSFIRLPGLDISYKSHIGSTSKFLVIVPKRLDKRAVKRNLSKRIIHESIRENRRLLTRSYQFKIKSTKIVKKTDRLQIDQQLRMFFKNLSLNK